MVSAATATATARPRRSAASLLAAYDIHVAALNTRDGPRYERRRSARRFLHQHPDLGTWMSRPAPSRLADLHRAGAWPFVTWCIAEGHLRPDLELLLAKPGGVDLPAAWAARFPGDVSALERAAGLLGWSANWTRQVTRLAASSFCLYLGKQISQVRDDDFDTVLGELDGLACVSASAREHFARRLFGLRQACYQLGGVAAPPRKGPPARTPAEQAAQITQPRIRAEVIRYVTTITATLRPTTAAGRTKALRVFFDYLAEHHPRVRRLADIDRTAHIEPYLAWARTRSWRGPGRGDRTIGVVVYHQDIVDLRCFFQDITDWGWASAPRRRLLFVADIPRLPEPMPRALPPDADRALMTAVAGLDDVFARTGLQLLRATGMRVGEMLDLELDCLIDFAGHGTWLKVPVGKLGTERMVPLEPATLTVVDTWMTHRGEQRALCHPRTGRPVNFLFLEHGTRPTAFRLRQGLRQAVAGASLRRPGGEPMHVTPHTLRHTFGTSLINGGISLPALMALMGHVTPEMTLRYARLASPAIRAAYQDAMGKIRARQPLPIVAIGGKPVIPDRVEWLSAEMLKTRLAHGYCARHPAAGPCPYANICEQCDNFVPDPGSAEVITRQLDDIKALHADARSRGWDDEAARHNRVATSLQQHLGSLS